MKFRRFAEILALTLCVCAFGACNRNNDDDDNGTLSGSVSFYMPVYVLRGHTYTIHPTGAIHPEGKGLGYYIMTSWDYYTRDTIQYETSPAVTDLAYDVHVPDTLAKELRVECYAYAENYYTKSLIETFVAVSDTLDVTITGLDYSDSDTTIVDSRDDKVYHTTKIGEKEWFKHNLAYAGKGIPYGKCDAMINNYGNYYTWNEAKEACPEGWHIPDGEEWLAVANYIAGEGTFGKYDNFDGIAGDFMVNAKFIGDRMWEYWPQVKITNKVRFNALPVGFCNDSGSGYPKFFGPDESCAFWTADEAGASRAYVRYFYSTQPDVLIADVDKDSFRASVRCVKD